MGYCNKDNHGFESSSGFWVQPTVTIYDLFTLDIHNFVDKYDGTTPSYDDSRNWNMPNIETLVAFAQSFILKQSEEEEKQSEEIKIN